MAIARSERKSSRKSERKLPAEDLAEKLVTDLVTSIRSPLLFALISAPKGAALREELLSLVRQFVPTRALREKVKILAKLLRPTPSGDVEEPVVIRDISSSGALLAISARTGLRAGDLKEIRLKLRIGGLDDVYIKARLARMVGADDSFVHAGFQFVNVPDGIGALLYDIQHAAGPSQSPATFSEEPTPATVGARTEDD